MNVYPHSPSEDREAWFQLASDVGAAMEQLGWPDWAHLPEPLDAETRRATCNYESWHIYSMCHSEQIGAIIETWCFEDRWPDLNSGQRYLLQLRSFTAATFIERLYVGSGNSGETLIPFPRHVAPPNLRRWWLTDWFESKGQDVLFHHMERRFWPTKAKFLSSATRKRLARERKQRGDDQDEGQ
jgi:hypothetical protein